MTDFKDIFEQVKENSRRWRECERHLYDPPVKLTLGAKHTCVNCGAVRPLRDIACYIDGYVAAGGDASDIWQGWGKNTSK